MNERPLTTADVAAELGVTERTITRWCEAGRFPHAYRLNPEAEKSPWLIPPSDVETVRQEEPAKQKSQAN